MNKKYYRREQKKKKRQIVSAALAAMMAMQLCIPSATFAAVPTKTVSYTHLRAHET